MKKMIRYAAAVFVTWAVVTYAWAAFSHVSGFVGPAEASGSSLDFVANAVEVIDPPGVLGAPQRFAAAQLRQAARSAERLNGSAERTMGELVDRLGHADAHHRRHRHHRHRPGRGRDLAEAIVIQLDDHGQARAQADLMARLELGLHRERTDRMRERAEQLRERGQERARRGLDRARREMQRAMERNRRHFDMEVRIGDEDRSGLRDLQVIESGQVLDLEDLTSQLEAAFDGFESEIDASLDKDELKRRLEEKIREILEGLGEDG